MLNLFRQLLKMFWRFYEAVDYNQITVEFQAYLMCNSEQLNLSKFEYSEGLDVENFWISISKSSNLNLVKSAYFMINLMLILNSNIYVERSFSKVNIIKNKMRNSLDVSTVSSIMKIKSFYEKFLTELFEPTEDHYLCYKHWIKDC